MASHPQTNLQLYALLSAAGWDDTRLARAAAAYELAQRLFGAMFRPSGKPFVCHLVGTAGALAQWGERDDLVLAGMLHSAHLYGDFQDGRKRGDPARRDLLRRLVGDAEELVWRYTHNRRQSIDAIEDADLLKLELADLFDELADLGPAYCPDKRVDELEGGPEGDAQLVHLALTMLGDEAASQLRSALTAWRSARVAPSLVRLATASSRADADDPRGVHLGRRLRRLAAQLDRFRWRRAA